jgi:hypothetical protein
VLAHQADKGTGITGAGRREVAIRRLPDLGLGRQRRQFEG